MTENKRTVEDLKDMINENPVVQASVQQCVDALKAFGKPQDEAIDIVGDIFKEFESELRKWLNETQTHA